MKPYQETALASKIDEQLQKLRDDKEPDAMLLKKLLTGKNRLTETTRNSMTDMYETKVMHTLSDRVRKVYPDLAFYITALNLHIMGVKYFTKWRELTKWLTFKPKGKNRDYYRYWTIHDWDQVIKDVQDGFFDPTKGKWAPSKVGPDLSYTRNKPNKYPVHTYTKHGYGGITVDPVIVTRHHFTPIFDVVFFSLYVYNRMKRFLKVKAINIVQITEGEVVGPAPEIPIKASDVVYLWDANNTRYTVDDLKDIYVLFGHNFVFARLVKQLKESINEYGSADGMYHQSVYIGTSDSKDKSNILRSLRYKDLHKDERLTKAVGQDIWVAKV